MEDAGLLMVHVLAERGYSVQDRRIGHGHGMVMQVMHRSIEFCLCFRDRIFYCVLCRADPIDLSH